MCSSSTVLGWQYKFRLKLCVKFILWAFCAFHVYLAKFLLCGKRHTKVSRNSKGSQEHGSENQVPKLWWESAFSLIRRWYHQGTFWKKPSELVLIIKIRLHSCVPVQNGSWEWPFIEILLHITADWGSQCLSLLWPCFSHVNRNKVQIIHHDCTNLQFMLKGLKSSATSLCMVVNQGAQG